MRFFHSFCLYNHVSKINDNNSPEFGLNHDIYYLAFSTHFFRYNL
jgi:hypothetical protein